MKFRIVFQDETEVIEEHQNMLDIINKYGRGNVQLIEGIEEDENLD
tara:strand:+ start:240 stop:377 length:138 start_codon:yes stop_codon:yes gene_type:complete